MSKSNPWSDLSAGRDDLGPDALEPVEDTDPEGVEAYGYPADTGPGPVRHAVHNDSALYDPNGLRIRSFDVHPGAKPYYIPLSSVQHRLEPTPRQPLWQRAADVVACGVIVVAVSVFGALVNREPSWTSADGEDW